MCNFSNLNNEDKKLQHEKLLECAKNFGGKNFFLNLLEAIRENKPHPLTSGNNYFDTEEGKITWNKTIFRDKIDLLLKARKNEREQDNLLPNKDIKDYKKILNVLRTLKPIVFHVQPNNLEDGSGFFFQAFDTINDDKTKLNPIFDAIFFCSTDIVKKMLNYKA